MKARVVPLVLVLVGVMIARCRRPSLARLEGEYA